MNGDPLPPVPDVSSEAIEMLALIVLPFVPELESNIIASPPAGVQTQDTPPEVSDQLVVALQLAAPPAGIQKHVPPAPAPQMTAKAGDDTKRRPSAKSAERRIFFMATAPRI